MSFFGSLFGGTTTTTTTVTTTPKINGVQYGATRLCLSGADGLIASLVEEKKMFGDPVVKSKLNTGAEPISDSNIFCLVSVSSNDKLVRIGDVVTVWCKFQGGACMSSELQQEASSASSAIGSLFGKAKAKPTPPPSGSPFASPSQASVPAHRRIKWTREDVGMLAWYVVASPMDERARDKVAQATSTIWRCPACTLENAFTVKACTACKAQKPPSAAPVVQVGDRVLLLPYTCADLVVHIGAQGITLEPYAPDAPGVVLTSISEPAAAPSFPQPPQSAPDRKATLSEKIIAAGVVNFLRDASAGAQFAAANPHPNADPIATAAVASAAPAIARAAEDRYARDPTLALQDLRTAANVVDRVASNPLAQKAASTFLTMAAAGINAAAQGGSTTTTTTTITSYK